MRALAGGFLAAMLGVVLGAPAANAATVVVGSPLTGTVTNELCTAPCTVANTSLTSGTTKVPADGTITSWSFKANTGAGSGTYALRVVRASGSGFVGAGTLTAPAVNTANTDKVFTQQASLPVKAGDFIGLDTLAGPGSPDLTSPPPADQITYFATPDLTDGGSALTGVTLPMHQVLVQATVQTTAASGGGNEDPNTKIKKRPKNKSDDASPTFKFKSTEPDSTFKCKLDHKKFRKCSSPKTYHGLDPGKHKFKVEAIDSDGNVDGTPAKDKFKVLPD